MSLLARTAVVVPGKAAGRTAVAGWVADSLVVPSFSRCATESD
ncbi:MAG: hypothetical protein AVDCRST_MAG75-2217 [uncultured Propionibacteriaceae bacterium]|uniref:Uncharacterized protein n=1 Tax=uncultured Propionibacteriaceae bacterium TaxID=257457 RepID=A0A6J4P6N5_9ACTN|nr:MAG: hypothetical protein AVDCRST_MAG75-2217 [uncultured Propionibacteriaceae bacterium]